jgi:regulator of sigma E protease
MAYLVSTAEYLIPFLLVLTVLVFIHELGHFLVARYYGVKVEVFSIGFGPELFGWNDKHQTRWKVSAIPLGGYVRMYGDADASSRPDGEAMAELTAEERSLTLHSKPILHRIAVIAAGPGANYLLAIVLLTGLFIFKGEPHLEPVVGQVLEGKLAEQAGIKAGDKIVSINGTAVSDFKELRNLISAQAGKDINLQILRGTPEMPISLSFKMESIDEKTKERKPVSMIGVAPGLPTYIQHNPFASVYHATVFTLKFSYDILAGIGQMIMGTRSAGELGGILSIGDTASQSAKGGLASLVAFMAILSINLGLINLLPIPVLDGGHILFYTIEGIRGKPVPQKAQEYSFMVGLFIVLSMMAVSTWNDISRYKLISWIIGN